MMKTVVYEKGPARFDMAGQRLPTVVRETFEAISKGLAERLRRHAESRLAGAGFTQAAGWKVEVYTLDGEDKPADRGYTVRFQNEKGGYIEVIGILTVKGWPSLDHGFAIGEED